MAINAWKTTFIGINKPPKVLDGTATAFSPKEFWAHQNGTNDPYWIGGSNPQYYQWEVDINVNSRQHGSHLTRTPFYFDAQDVEVGDFVAGAQDGKVVQIKKVLVKTNSSVKVLVEDTLRYNTFRDPTGFGLFTAPGPVVIFQINELGHPMLDPVPGTCSTDFFSNVQSRFQYMNPLTNYILEQAGHNFEQGDAICIEGGLFELSDVDNVEHFIGTVVFPGPGPDQFILRPANGIIDFVPGLPGSVGEYIYPSIDGSGDLTTDASSARPIFMKIADAIATSSYGDGIDPNGTDGDIIEINGTQLTLLSGTGSYDLDDAVGIINSQTSAHKITALKTNAPTEVSSNTAGNGNAYGIVAGYVPIGVTINGVSVTFTTDTSGSQNYGAGIADANDFVEDINAAGITNITASLTNGNEIKLTNKVGGSITIVNVSPDGGGNNWAGAGSLSSLDLTTAANTTTFALALIRDDGGPMTLRDLNGLFLNQAGVISGQTGRFALGLNIEQGIRASATSVVADITARDALLPLVGDQAYVIDDGDGEWGMYLYDGSNWNRFNNQRAEDTDARTLTSGSLTLPIAVQDIGSISADRRVLNVAVKVITEIVGVCTLKVTVGTEEVFDIVKHGGTEEGTYVAETTYITSNYEDIQITGMSAATSGEIKVEVTYI